MRLVERHQVSDQTFRVETGNNLPAFRWRVGTGELQSVRRERVTNAAPFIKETIGRHVRISVYDERRLKMQMMPGREVHKWLACGEKWHWPSCYRRARVVPPSI